MGESADAVVPTVSALQLMLAGAAVFPVRVWIGEDGKKTQDLPNAWDTYTATPADAAAAITAACGYGVDTARSGLLVVDLDVKPAAGIDAVKLWTERGYPRSTLVVRTQSGGEHHYFRLPDGAVFPNAKWCMGVDVRGRGKEGRGGFVYGPGTVVAGGGSYTLAPGAAIPDSLADLPPAPVSVLEALKEEHRDARRAARREKFGEAAPVVDVTGSAVEQCASRVEFHWADLESAVTDGGFNEQLNTVLFVAGQWFRARHAAGETELTHEDARQYVVDRGEQSEVILPWDASDWATINGTGAEEGWNSPFVPSAGVELGADLIAKLAPARPVAVNEDPEGAAEAEVGETPAAGRPEINVGNAALTAEWLRENLGAGRLSGMFLRDGSIVYTPREGADGYQAPKDGRDNDGPAQIRRVDIDDLRARVQHLYRPVVVKKDVMLDATFPKEAAALVVPVPDTCPRLRPLRGTTHTPVLRPDGTVLTRPGYDDATRLLYLPAGDLFMPPVPDTPTETDVAGAVELLTRMVGDFPFETEDDRAGYLGLLLTPVVRQVAPGPHKLAAITAPMPGSGKSLLAEILREVHGAVWRAEMPSDKAELRKQITSILDGTTSPLVVFDNMVGTIKSPDLAGLMTSTSWSDRRLGSTTDVNIPNDRVWVVTGNNVQVGGDFARRTLWIRIDPNTPNPERRQGFAIPNLVAWVCEHRGVILQALLTIARAWAVAGQPRVPGAEDSFAAWRSAIAGMLSVAGVPGTFDPAVEVLGEDDAEWRTFLEAVHGAVGDERWTAKSLLTKIDLTDPRYAVGTGQRAPIPLDALPADMADGLMRAPASGPRVLGRWLRNRDGRWAGELAARKAGGRTSRGAEWQIVTKGYFTPRPSVNECASVLQEGSFLAPSREKNNDQGRESTYIGGPKSAPAEALKHSAPPDQSAASPPLPGDTKPARRSTLTPEEKAAKTEAARVKRAAAAEAKRLAAVADANGRALTLPAVVDRVPGGVAVREEPLFEAARLVEVAMVRSGSLTVDIEHTGYPVGHRLHALRTIQLGDALTSVVFDGADPDHRSVARALFDRCGELGLKLHAHSATADLIPLAHAGVLDAA